MRARACVCAHVRNGFWFCVYCSATRPWSDLPIKWCTALWLPWSGNAARDSAVLLVKKVSEDRGRRHTSVIQQLTEMNRTESPSCTEKWSQVWLVSVAPPPLFMSLWLVTIHVPLVCIAVLKPAFPICLYEWFPLGLHKATSVLWMKLRNKIPQHPTTLLITFYVFIPRVAAPVRLPSLLRLWILFCRLNWVFYPQKSYASAVYIFRPR